MSATRRTGGLATMGRTWKQLALVASVCFAAGCTSNAVEVSFKTVTFEHADRDRAFDVCEQVVANYYSGTKIRIDKAGGRIETDPIEETIRGKAMRQQCYVQVKPLANDQVEIALLARLQRLEIERGDDNPVRWIDAGSDVQVEGLLLDEISGRILALEIDAKVVGDTVPRASRPR